MKEDQFYPPLFNTKKKPIPQKPPDIPLNTLKHEQTRKSALDEITVFGYSDHKKMIERINECGKVLSLEYGSNYTRVIFDDEESYKKCLKMNHKVIDGNIVGVFRNKVEVKNCVKAEGGLLKKIFEYLF
ncbi:hypothetical protein DMUE_3785 [Dictyocoela muelleri]|nr:hypothetical protein DMUE_3785 [Dictyocoela muelleri]